MKHFMELVKKYKGVKIGDIPPLERLVVANAGITAQDYKAAAAEPARLQVIEAELRKAQEMVRLAADLIGGPAYYTEATGKDADEMMRKLLDYVAALDAKP